MINTGEAITLSDYAKTRFFIRFLDRNKHENCVGVGKIVLAEESERLQPGAFYIEFEQCVKIGSAKNEDGESGLEKSEITQKLVPLPGTRKINHKQLFSPAKSVKVIVVDHELEIKLDNGEIELYLPHLTPSMQCDHIESILRRSTLT